jgi:hypothetical protein
MHLSNSLQEAATFFNKFRVIFLYKTIVPVQEATKACPVRVTALERQHIL